MVQTPRARAGHASSRVVPQPTALPLLQRQSPLAYPPASCVRPARSAQSPGWSRPLACTSQLARALRLLPPAAAAGPAAAAPPSAPAAPPLTRAGWRTPELPAELPLRAGGSRAQHVGWLAGRHPACGKRPTRRWQECKGACKGCSRACQPGCTTGSALRPYMTTQHAPLAGEPRC